MTECVVCHAEIDLAKIGPGLCDSRKCRRVWLGQKPLEKQRAHNKAIHDEARRLADEVSPADDPLPLIILPSNDRPLVKLPHESREAFLDRLDRLFGEVSVGLLPLSVEPAEPSSPPARTALESHANISADSVLNSACAACRGHCCTGGGNHAHLDKDSVDRIREEMNWTDVEEARSAYQAFFPETHFQGSCVFHAEYGCSLPRGMRGDVCNRYLCGSLTELKRAVDAGAEAPFVAVTANAMYPVRVLRIDQSSAVLLARAADVSANRTPNPNASKIKVDGSGTAVIAAAEKVALN